MSILILRFILEMIFRKETEESLATKKNNE